MKKVIKSLSIICLALVLVCPVFFVGCARHYTINVSVVNTEGGNVYKPNQEAQILEGDFPVEKGSTFKYSVVPNEGYVIAEILIDGKPLPKEEYSETGATLNIDNVKSNHTIKVTFDGTQTIVLKVNNEEFETLQIKKNGILDLSGDKYSGYYWYYYNDNNDRVYIHNGQSEVGLGLAQGHTANKILIKKSMTIFGEAK